MCKHCVDFWWEAELVNSPLLECIRKIRAGESVVFGPPTEMEKCALQHLHVLPPAPHPYMMPGEDLDAFLCRIEKQ